MKKIILSTLLLTLSAYSDSNYYWDEGNFYAGCSKEWYKAGQDNKNADLLDAMYFKGYTTGIIEALPEGEICTPENTTKIQIY